MPGCLDKCALLWEDHSIFNADNKTRQKIAEELSKYKDEQSHDPSFLKSIIKRWCLGGFLTDENNLPKDCIHFINLPSELSCVWDQ